MKRSHSNRRKAENEIVFRKRNDRALRMLAETRGLAAEDHQEPEIKGIEDIELLFYCECIDNKCRQRIAMTPKEYVETRKNARQFILVPGHHEPEIERVISKGSKYVVVEKFILPSSTATELNPI